MFTKLLKHEWRATRGVIGLLCIIILISGLTIGCVTHYMVKTSNANDMIMISEEEDADSEEASMSDMAEITCALLIMVAVMAAAVCCAGSVVFVIWRFYESRFSNEGYLTFTLPVNNHQLLLSSILNSIFCVLIVMVAAAAAVMIAFALCLSAFPMQLIWADVAVSFENAMRQLWKSFVENWEVLASLGLSGILSALSQLIMIMLSVTVGAIIARKHKILAAVAVYYGIGIIRSFISAFGIIMTTAVTKNVMQVFSLYNVTSLTIIVGGYFLMYYLIDRKLNLT